MEEGTTESMEEARPAPRPDSRPPWKIRQDESRAARQLAREKLRSKISRKLQWLSRKEGAKGVTIPELQRLCGFESSAGIVEVLAEMDRDGEAHAIDGTWWEGPRPEPAGPPPVGTSLDETKQKVMQVLSSAHRWWMPMEVMGAVSGATLADAKAAIDMLVRDGVLLREGGAGRICIPPAPLVHQVGPRPMKPTRPTKKPLKRPPRRLHLPTRSVDAEVESEPSEEPVVTEPVSPPAPASKGVDLTKAEALSAVEAMSLGQAVRAKRMSLGLSQGKVGEMVKIGQSDVSKAERGESFFGRTVRVLSAWVGWTREQAPEGAQAQAQVEPRAPSPEPRVPDPVPPPLESAPVVAEPEPVSSPESIPEPRAPSPELSLSPEMTAAQLLDRLDVPDGTLRERTMWLEGFMAGAGRPVRVG